MVCDENGGVIRDSAQVLKGTNLVITPAKGNIKAKVIDCHAYGSQ